VDGPDSRVRQRFRSRVAEQPAQFAGPELLPVRLARAAVDLLPGVAGVGITVQAPRGARIPIGASDPDAATAERLQFTFGEGPCLQAATTGRPVLADPARYTRSWPLLYEEMMSRTPYRAVLSLPLQRPGAAPFGSVNLHFRGALPRPSHGWPASTTVTDEIAAMLTAAPSITMDGSPHTPPPGPDEPAWLHSAPARRRQQVWIAVGMLTVQLDLHPGDALAELRALAFTAGRDIDHYAGDLVDQRIPLPDRDR
jgi:hypothetical protein